jgi:hypothetical protein
VEGICHFWVFPAVIKAFSRAGYREPSHTLFPDLRNQVKTSLSGSLHGAKSSNASNQTLARQVRMYCFWRGNCGTFMPLSRVRGVFRIAVVWTRFAAAISAISSIHFNVLFTYAIVRLAVDCE